MTTTEDTQVWTEPGSYPLLPPSTQCNRPVEHTAAGVTLTFYCGLAPGHLSGCAPLDTQNRNPITDPYYQAPAELDAPRRVAARRTARAKVEKPAEAEKEEQS